MLPTNRHKSMNKRRRNIAIVAGASVVVIGGAVLVLITGDVGGQNNNEYVSSGLYVEEDSTNIDYEASTTRMEDGVNEGREYYINYVDLAVLKKGGGSFDIHIRFPNGEDYVVVTNIRITDVTDDGFYTVLDDKENHMLSSAKTDSDVYAGTQLYLAKYDAELSQIKEPDYPCNQYVLSGHYIGAEDAEEIYVRRIQLEENLVSFMNQTLNR